MKHRGTSLLSRREFLSLAAGWTAGCQAATAPAPRRPANPYLVGCYTRPWDEHELPRALDGIAEAGYQWAGIMTAKGKSWVVITPETTSDEAGKVGWLAQERGLKVCSVYGEFSAKESAATARRQLERLIEHAAACGSPDLLLGGTGDASLYEPYYDAIRRCCDYAAERKVRLSIKPHGGLNATGIQCRQAIEKVGHPNFRLWYDPGNILYYSDGKLDPLEDVVTVDGLVAGMSIKDFKPPKEVLVTPGTGEVNFPVLFARLRFGGFRRGPLVVECTTRGDFRAVTAEAVRARQFVERLALGRGLDGMGAPAGEAPR